MSEPIPLAMDEASVARLKTAIARIMNFRVIGPGGKASVTNEGITIFLKDTIGDDVTDGINVVMLRAAGDGGDGWYKWDEAEWVDATPAWTILAGGKTSEDYGEIYDISGHAGPVWGDAVLMVTMFDSEAAPINLFFTTPRTFFPVLVTKTSGVSGSKTAKCEYVYTVTDMNGTELGAGMTPGKERTLIGAYVAIGDGSVGMGYYDLAGDFALWDANEVPLTEACT